VPTIHRLSIPPKSNIVKAYLPPVSHANKATSPNTTTSLPTDLASSQQSSHGSLGHLCILNPTLNEFATEIIAKTFPIISIVAVIEVQIKRRIISP
jgi:hypothetical protein